MVLYRSPEQTDLHTTVEVSAKFTALNFITLHPTNPHAQQPCIGF